MRGLIQPKPFMDQFKLRHNAGGVERRRNMSKVILEKGTPFPKPIAYEDIDKAFYDWADKKLDISYDGTRLPTYRLFSNQKLSEYSQTWENLDETGNIIMNFKTITRENNPQHGESQGNSFNVPGHRDYPMFAVPVLQENGEEVYDVYTMKQPFSVNFSYVLNLIANKYELLNRFNEMVHYEFQSLECYIAPNGHAMPMVLDSVNDESEYVINDRKFYSQSYKIKVMGYIIRKGDYNVHRVPSRFIMRLLGVEDYDIWRKNGFKESNGRKRDSSYDLRETGVDAYGNFNSGITSSTEVKCGVGNGRVLDIKRPHPTVTLREEELPDNKCLKSEGDHYYNKSLEYDVGVPDCESGVTFTMESDMVLEEVSTENVYDFVIHINGELADLDNGVKFYGGDSVNLSITRNDLFKGSKVALKGYDPNIRIDGSMNAESALDEISDGEKFNVNGNDEDDNGSGETASDD